MHEMREYGGLPVGDSNMTKTRLIRILVTVQCVLGLLMIVMLTR